jgi:hypothetical protein
MINSKLPKESESQEIGRFAVMTFNSCHPTSWRPTPTEGDADAGLDFQVQIVDKGHHTNIFNAQIKGSAQKEKSQNKKLSADGKHFAQPLEISTLNYYARIENPVMLVFVDLAQNADPRKCPAYYLWIDEEIKRLRAGKPNLDHLGKDSQTFHIPVENILDPDLNVLPYLNHRLEKRRALEGIYDIVEKKYPDPINKVNQVGEVLKTNKIALDTILNKTETPWLNAPKDSFAYQLKEGAEFLSLNNAKLAQDKLDRLGGRIKEANGHEKSEYYYQRGYLAGLIGNRDEALELHKKAHLTSKGIKKYHIAYLESRIPYAIKEDRTIDNIIVEIPSQDDIDYLRLKSKLLALKGKHKEALKNLEGRDEKEVFVLKALIHLLSGSYSDCIHQIEKTFSEQTLTPRQELSLRALKARAYFNLGFSNIPHDKTIPFTGTPDMNPEILTKSWMELLSAWELAEQLGYPPDVETMIDMLSILGMYFSEPDIVKTHLVKLAEIRPAVQNIQETLLQVAMYLDDRDTAERQLSKLPKTLKNKVNKIILTSQKNDKLKVVNLTSEILDDLIKEKPINSDAVLANAAEFANDLLMYKERDKFLSALHAFPDSEGLLALYEFIVQTKQESLKKPQAVEKLYDIYKKDCKSYQILDNLLNNLNPYTSDSASKLIEISNDITSTRDLSDNEYIILCQAKATIQDWKGVLETSRRAQIRFANNPRFKAFEALALDEMGETGRAIELLEEISKGEKHDPLAFNIYIDISARCGLIKKAKTLVTRLLEKTTETKQILHLLRMMFNIELYIDPKSESLIDICLKYGRLCDQDDESEEGLYLLQFFTATLHHKKEDQDNDVKDFQERLNKYVKKFPESKVLRSFQIKDNEPEVLLSQLKKITGFTEEKERWYQRNEILLSRSQYPVPYIIRHKLLLNVSNFIHLWELSKIAGKEYPQYLLTISAGQYKIRKIEDFKERIPLIDGIALIVLFDLGLLEYLFKIFPKVAIAKDTIINLQMVAQDFLYTSYTIKAKNIIELLSNHVSNIQQPSSMDIIEKDHIFSELDLIKSAYNPSKHIFYTDDAIARLYVCGEDHYNDSISTIDIIIILKGKNLISPKEAAEKFAHLCGFNVLGTLIRYKDILIVLEGDLPKGESVECYLEHLTTHQNFNSFINSIWWFKGDYTRALTEIGQFISLMISREDGIYVEQNIITAIWYIWYQKVQFIIQAEKDKLYFLARSFLSTSIALSERIASDHENKECWEKAWSIYDDIVQFVYGNDMNREIENKSRSLLAQMIAEFEFESRRKIFSHIASGLTSDTAESDFFQKAYTENSIAIQKEHDTK